MQEYNSLGQKIYRCGSLIYTKRGLVALFAWLLWGDFCFTMKETVVPSILPLKLRSLGSANWIIALIMSTLPGVFNTTICPWVSFKSDHYRSRWGRRIPFILYTMPFLTVSLLFVGYSESIGGWLHGWAFSGGTISRTMVVVTLLAVFAGMFDLFNMFVGSVYYYLFNDVVPEQFLSRFFGWFRLVGVASSALYNFFIFRFALSHMQQIYTGATVLYFVGFGLMCLRVKEREYPPPPDQGQAPSLLRDIKGFGQECFTMPFYWCIFLNTMFVAVSGTIGVFGVFFQQSMGLDLAFIGKVSAASGVVTAICLTFAGVLADRWHPIRVDAYLNVFGAFSVLTGLTWIFVDPPCPNVYFWVVIFLSGTGALLGAVGSTAYMPRLMLLFPDGRFGAFCGAQALVRSAGTMVGGLLAGIYLDLVKHAFPAGSLRPYRYMAVWQIVFGLVAFAFYYRVYRYWKRLGGETGFKAPITPVRFADLPKGKNSDLAHGMVVLIIIAWAGLLLANAFFTGYFHIVVHDPHSARIYGLVTVLVFFGLPALVRFLRFMERP